jgi:hypothetical protein
MEESKSKLYSDVLEEHSKGRGVWRGFGRVCGMSSPDQLVETPALAKHRNDHSHKDDILVPPHVMFWLSTQAAC